MRPMSSAGDRQAAGSAVAPAAGNVGRSAWAHRLVVLRCTAALAVGAAVSVAGVQLSAATAGPATGVPTVAVSTSHTWLPIRPGGRD